MLQKNAVVIGIAIIIVTGLYFVFDYRNTLKI